MSDVYNLPHGYLYGLFLPSTRTFRSGKLKATRNQWQTNRTHWCVPTSALLPDYSHPIKSPYIPCSEAHPPYLIFENRQFLSHIPSVRDDTKNGQSIKSYFPPLYLRHRNIRNFLHRYLASASLYPYPWRLSNSGIQISREIPPYHLCPS